MRQRSLGKTGLSVTELGLGTWGLSGDGYSPVPEADRDAVIDRARALGITLFETADVYGHGDMEERLGRRLPKDKCVIVTKIGTDRDGSPPRKRFSPEYLREAFDASQKRLGRDTVDVVLLHNPSAQALEDHAACEVLEKLVDAGRLRTWGVSCGSAEVLRLAVEARKAPVVQLAFNVFNSSALDDVGELIDERGTGVLARSVLAHGLLCGHWPMHKEFPDGDHRVDRWSPDQLRNRIGQLGALRSIIGGPVLTMRSGALRFVLQQDRISGAVLGPRSAVQLDQLVREAGRATPYLSEEKLQKLTNRLTDVGVISA